MKKNTRWRERVNKYFILMHIFLRNIGTKVFSFTNKYYFVLKNKSLHNLAGVMIPID